MRLFSGSPAGGDRVFGKDPRSDTRGEKKNNDEEIFTESHRDTRRHERVRGRIFELV